MTINNTATSNAIAQQTYVVYTYALNISAFALLLYVTMLNFSEEMEYIWTKRFRLPALFYVFTRYGCLVMQGLNVALKSIAVTETQKCYVLTGIQLFWFELLYIGVQGLLIARVHSLSEGNKVLTALSAVSFGTGLIVSLFETIRFSTCVTNIGSNATSVEENILNFIQACSTVCTDLIVFGVCIWKTWSTWILNRNNGIWSFNGIASVLIKQSILRCCFVILITVSFAVFELLNVGGSLTTNFLSVSQNTLSAILVADFTLELHRRNNSKEIKISNMTLPTFGFQTVFEHLHQSILVGMATPEYEVEIISMGDDSEGGRDIC